MGSPFLTSLLPSRLPLTSSHLRQCFFLRQMAIFIRKSLVSAAPHHGWPSWGDWQGRPGAAGRRAEHGLTLNIPPGDSGREPQCPEHMFSCFGSSQREKVGVIHTQTPGTMQVLITVLIVLESQNISPVAPQKPFILVPPRRDGAIHRGPSQTGGD